VPYYIDVVDGREIKSPKGRGRTKKGYVEVEPGIWRKDSKASEKSEYRLVKMNPDGTQDIREVKRGRKPAGYVKCVLQSDGTLIPAEESNLQPAGVSSEEEDPETEQVAPVSEAGAISLREFLGYVKPLRKKRETGKMSLYCCDIVSGVPIPFFQEHPVVGRIDIALKTGDVYVWHYEYEPEQPDDVLEGLLIPENKN
jgi:hypothetical protein